MDEIASVFVFDVGITVLDHHDDLSHQVESHAIH